MNYIDLFIVILIIGFSFVYVRESFMEVSYVKSTVDGKKYLVQNRKNSIEAANLLANINKNLIRLISILKQKYSEDPRAKRIINNYNPDTITEGTGEKNYTSYSVNKGEKIVFCITVRNDENNKKLMDLNTMLYVGIHELAHLGTKEIGHVDVFWKNFKWILKIAEKEGIYKYEDYRINPKKYCGIIINSNILDNSDY
jgi:predicted metal-dependent hydrolase